MNQLMSLVTGRFIITPIKRVKPLFVRQLSIFSKYDKSNKKLAVETSRKVKLGKLTFMSITIIGGVYLLENSAKRRALVEAGTKLIDVLNPNSETTSFSSHSNDLFQTLSELPIDILDWAKYKINALYLTRLLIPIAYIPVIIVLIRGRTYIPSVIYHLAGVTGLLWLLKQIYEDCTSDSKVLNSRKSHQRVKRVFEELKQKNPDMPGIEDITFELTRHGSFYCKGLDKHVSIQSRACADLSSNKVVILQKHVDSCQTDELAFTLAHEMGHLILNKVLRDTMQPCGCSANIRFTLVNGQQDDRNDIDDYLGTYSKNSKGSELKKYLEERRKIEYIADSIGGILIGNTSFDMKEAFRHRMFKDSESELTIKNFLPLVLEILILEYFFGLILSMILVAMLLQCLNVPANLITEDMCAHPMNRKRVRALLQDLPNKDKTITIEENSNSDFQECFLKVHRNNSSEESLCFHMKLDCYEHTPEIFKQLGLLPKNYKPIG